MTTVKIRGNWFAPLFSLALLTCFADCGGSSDDSPKDLACGPGTVEIDHRCVPVPVMDAGLDQPDVSTQDSTGSGQDAAIDRAAPIDAAPNDLTAEVATDSQTILGDSCPPQRVAVNCSADCGGPTSDCSAGAP